MWCFCEQEFTGGTARLVNHEIDEDDHEPYDYDGVVVAVTENTTGSNLRSGGDGRDRTD
jgi:hypothetical protein